MKARRVEEPTGAGPVPQLTAVLDRRPGEDEPDGLDLLDIWGLGSFPASDPPANW